MQPRDDEMYDDEALQGGKLELGLGRVIRYHSEQAPIPFAIVEQERHLATAILRHHSFRFGHGNQRTAGRARGDGRLHIPLQHALQLGSALTDSVPSVRPHNRRGAAERIDISIEHIAPAVACRVP